MLDLSSICNQPSCSVHSALYIYLFLCGIAVYVHFICMANFMKKAPFLLKYILLPAASGLGVLTSISSLLMKLELALISASLTLGAIICIWIVCWARGLKVSDFFAEE